MTAPAKITPPLADYLKRIDQAKRDLAKGVFPADGLVSPASDSNSGYEVRIWDETGAKTVQCPTPADVTMCLTIARDRALFGQYIARQISHDFYQAYFDAIDARNPLQVTETEARLCGACRKLAKAMVVYNAVVQARDEGNPNSTAHKRFRALALTLDRAISRANNLFAES